MGYTIGLGDLLASFSPNGYERFSQATDYKVTYTGAEANVLGSLSNFGLDTRFVCRVPDNDIGTAAIRHLRSLDIDTSFIVRGGERLGVLYLEKGASQRPSKVIYDRMHSGICTATVSDFDFEAIFKDAEWFHFTGITPALSDSLVEVVKKACIEAKNAGCMISCDLNYRKNLWTTEKAKEVMTPLMEYVDILIANEEDVEKVLGIKPVGSDVEEGRLDNSGYIDVARQLCDRFNFKAVATTLRESISASMNNWSALLYMNGKTYLSKKYQIQIVNRVGGGDSFAAGLIYGFQKQMEAQELLEFATAASCLKHTIEYDYNMVSVEEVKQLMMGKGNGRVQR